MIQQKAKKEAGALFDRISLKSSISHVLHTITRRNNELLCYDMEREAHPQVTQHYGGVQSIMIDDIKGSLNRCYDFNANFLPRNTNSRKRWINVATAMFQGIGLPAIKVYHLNGIYFVEDGHHRVSVAKALGYLYIDAVVIEVEASINKIA